MNDTDRLVAEWAATEATRITGVAVTAEEVSRVQFDGEAACYSSWTHEFDITADIVLKTGQTVHTPYAFASVLYGLAAYEAARDKAREDCARSHGDTIDDPTDNPSSWSPE